MDLPERVSRHAARLQKRLEQAVTEIREPRLRDAALHYPSAGGKALRPAMAVLACEAAGGRAEEADPLALGVELLHTFSLVHDDLMDQDDVRRGVPAVHRAFDEPLAILAGDALYALSFEQLAQLEGHPRALTIVAEVARTARTLCEGQTMDMAFETDWPDVDTYEAMIEGKTAALFACATGNGARIATDDPAVIEALTTFGRSLGLAFQVQDDVLDLVADEDELGKPVGSDVRAGKKTHPLIKARGRASPRDGERLAHLLEHGAGDEDVAWTIELCRETGALEASRARVEALFDQAQGALARLPDSQARDDLSGLAAWVRQRGH